MRDNNILTRFIKPAARKIGLPFVNWRCLRTSHATWPKLAGADVKDAGADAAFAGKHHARCCPFLRSA